MKRLRTLAVLTSAFVLAACGGQSVWAPDTAVEQARIVTGEQPYLELKTMVSNTTGRGGHSSLLINGSQLVLWDPAGRWRHSTAPERNDVVFGMTPALLAQYDSWHARNTHHVVSQRIYVTPQVAEMAMQLAFNNGPSLDAHCAQTTSGILQRLPGFEGIRSTWYPHVLMAQFETLPSVETRRHYESDVGKN
ncbi:MAG: hypothetical protein AAF631_09445 [Pseudomonadota bacterium]